MTITQVEIQLVAIMVAVACALPGVFLVLRRTAMMSDAISHSILLGIVLAYFVVQDLASPLLIIAATLTGILTVSLVQLINRTRLVKEDAAIGIVFPALFSIGVILIAKFAGKVHLDTDAVLLGELAFVTFNRFVIFGYDLGPKALYLMGGIFVVNLTFIILFFKELKLSTFDAGLAASLGFAPGLIHYALMTLVSVTAVGAFDAVGSILVVALMIGPPVSAYLLTEKLSRMIILSMIIGIINAVSGYWVANWFDVSIAGSMATMTGVIFLLIFLLAPNRGVFAIVSRRFRQKWEFAQTMLAIHLFTHEDSPEAMEECRYDHLGKHLRWTDQFSERVVSRAVRHEIIRRDDQLLELTNYGRELAKKAIVR